MFQLFAVLKLKVIHVEFIFVIIAIKRPLVEIIVAIRAAVWIVVCHTRILFAIVVEKSRPARCKAGIPRKEAIMSARGNAIDCPVKE